MPILKPLLTHYTKELFKIRTKPKVIQLPVTSKCNSRCLTCNVWKNRSTTDIDPEHLEQIFADPYLTEVVAVGINGGEISLYRNNTDRLIQAVLSLPKLTGIYVISNGLYSERLLQILQSWKRICKAKNVTLTVTLSIDGVGDIHNQIRGVNTAFMKTIHTLECILADKDTFCDQVRIGCTISKYNVAYLPQIEVSLEKYQLKVDYHLAVPNKRIDTFEDANYSVLEDERSRLLAAEFFLGKSIQTRKLFDKFGYFSVYYYLMNRGKGRLSSCDYRRQDVTIDESLNLYLCATASNKIASLTEETVTHAMNSLQLDKVEKDVSKCCDTCIHYGASLPTFKGTYFFVKYLLHNRLTWNYKFKYLTKWQKL